jgi:hypothetical protein
MSANWEALGFNVKSGFLGARTTDWCDVDAPVLVEAMNMNALMTLSVWPELHLLSAAACSIAGHIVTNLTSSSGIGGMQRLLCEGTRARSSARTIMAACSSVSLSRMSSSFWCATLPPLAWTAPRVSAPIFQLLGLPGNAAVHIQACRACCVLLPHSCSTCDVFC